MRCNTIVLINLSTMDSKEELEENRKSLKRKYETRGQNCIEVNWPSDKIQSLVSSGTVGVYVLSHTKDVVPSILAGLIFNQMISQGANVRKISIACCKAAMGKDGPMMKFCDELAKFQTDKITLPVGLMVCGFNINITTFDSKSDFMDKEGKKFSNYDKIKSEATIRNRDVATVRQAWATLNSGEPNFMHFVHEKMGSGQSPVFIQELINLFSEKLVESWDKNGVSFIKGQFNKNQKPAKQINDPENWSWGDFSNTYPDWGRQYVKKVFWKDFIDCIKSVNHRSAAMWVSLDGYVRMKSVMKFDGKSFKPVALSEYAENEDMKNALSFVDMVNKDKGCNLLFFPEI